MPELVAAFPDLRVLIQHAVERALEHR